MFYYSVKLSIPLCGYHEVIVSQSIKLLVYIHGTSLLNFSRMPAEAHVLQGRSY